MSIVLATLTLPDGLRWVDEYATVPVAQTVRARLDGGWAVYPRAVTGGREITLVAPEDHWLTRAQADALAVMAAVSGASYVLSLRGTSYTVLFRHHDPPALDLQPLVDWGDAQNADPIIGTIKLMTL